MNRIFTAKREPNARQVLFYILIVSVLTIATFVPARDLHAALRTELWQHPALDVPEEMSSGMVWLLAANLVSLFAVAMLFFDLWGLTQAVNIHMFSLDAECAAKRCGFKTSNNHAIENPLNWALGPLRITYTISITVLCLTLITPTFIVAKHPRPSELNFLWLVLFTGIIYLSFMTAGDVCARTAYRRTTCLRHRWATDHSDAEKAQAMQSLESLLETLNDYDRLFWYVDVPILASLALVTFHKFVVLQHESAYQLGFLAGAVAMHTIIANVDIPTMPNAIPTRSRTLFRG